MAQSAIVPHLSQRTEIFVLDANPPAADYVIAASHLSPWPLPTAEALAHTIRTHFTDGYAIVFERDGWTVLARRAPPE